MLRYDPSHKQNPTKSIPVTYLIRMNAKLIMLLVESNFAKMVLEKVEEIDYCHKCADVEISAAIAICSIEQTCLLRAN